MVLQLGWMIRCLPQRSEGIGTSMNRTIIVKCYFLGSCLQIHANYVAIVNIPIYKEIQVTSRYQVVIPELVIYLESQPSPRRQIGTDQGGHIDCISKSHIFEVNKN